jgi:hypothetical protein
VPKKLFSWLPYIGNNFTSSPVVFLVENHIISEKNLSSKKEELVENNWRAFALS